jgi:urease accessory protein
MLTFTSLRRLGLMALTLIAANAWAHADATHAHASFFSGVLHPLTGIDHFAAMLAVGIWSALAMRKAWIAPALFVTTMSCGIWLGAVGFDLTCIEPIIATSVLVMGVLVAARQLLSARIALMLVAVFGLCHGAAHGIALQGEATVASMAGMLFTTLLLHTFGVMLGQRTFAQRVWLQRVTGGAFSALGVALLSSFV